MSTLETVHGEAAASAPDNWYLGDFGPLVGGSELRDGEPYAVRSPYDDHVVAMVFRADGAMIEQAIATAADAFQMTRHLPVWKRAEVLERVSTGLAADREKFARTIALEAGKPIRTARAEVDRAIFTFKVAAEETKRIYGEIVPLDWLPGNERRVAHVRHVPLGVVAGITPFNFPLNLVAHKVAPAMAAGNPIIIRPASATPVSALLLGRLVLESGWPEGGIAVVPSSTADAGALVSDDRIRLLSFTGSPAVGWQLKGRAGRKRITLELGGNAGVIVHSDADIALAANRITYGAFTNAGQSCISVQRVYLHETIADAFLDKFLPSVRALHAGDPLDEATDVGPLIDFGEADRVDTWMRDALAGGARVLTGGERRGSVWQPTVVADVREEMRISCQEVFAPVVVIYRYSEVDAAIRAVGASDFGLQAGLFTNDLRVIDAADDQIEVGGLMINDVSTFRIDHMPYGGVKQSGFGREGVRYAIEEMSELKLLMYNHQT